MRVGQGFLAIWSDVFDHEQVDYLHWLTREHTQERVGIAGFDGVRVFRARKPGVNRYFILYRLADPSVMASPGYLERLNAPTAWSRRIMPILKNFARGGGEVVATAGQGRASTIAPVLIDRAAIPKAKEALARLVARDLVIAASVLEVDAAGTMIKTNEKALRGDDRSFGGLLLIEATDAASLEGAVAAADQALDVPEIYDQIFALDAGDLRP
jgi:hypothetical protein